MPDVIIIPMLVTVFMFSNAEDTIAACDKLGAPLYAPAACAVVKPRGCDIYLTGPLERNARIDEHYLHERKHCFFGQFH